MFAYGKSRTEEQQALSQRRGERALQEREDAQQEIAEKKARLKAMRLAKQAADKEQDG